MLESCLRFSLIRNVMSDGVNQGSSARVGGARDWKNTLITLISEILELEFALLFWQNKVKLESMVSENGTKQSTRIVLEIFLNLV